MSTHPSEVFAIRPGLAALLVVGCLALTITSCGDDDANAPNAVGLPALLPLHATRGDQPGIFDASGRQVILRGVNLNALGDYYQPNPAYPSVIPLRDSDFPQMARQGFDVVRLIMNWSLLEPARGQISADYLKRIHVAVDAAKANAIYVVLDMHHDAWGKYIASPPGVTCPAGRERAVGWDGAPEWATITDGKSTCRVAGVRELSPAVIAAVENFYMDRGGIQTELVKVWAAVAREFAREPAVAGYDLLNEPHFGADIIGATPKVAAYYTRSIDAIRAAEREAGGFSHIVFFEPVDVWPSPGTTPSAGFTADTNIVFAPHNYVESLQTFNATTIEEGFALAAQDAASDAVTFWIGEYGWFGDPAANKAKVIRYARAEDSLLVGGTWWQWHQACGDPHTIGMQGGQPPHELIHFNRTFCPGDVDGGPVPEWDVVLSRPYPRAAPGRLVTLESDGDAATLHLTGMTDAVTHGTLDIWVPAHGSGMPVVTGTNVGMTRVVAVASGFRVLIDISDRYDVAVALR